VTITPAAVIYGFLCGLGSLLGLVLLVLCVRQLKAGEKGTGDTLVLGLVLGQAVFLIRLLAWPCFYWLLKSYIPLIPGAMCVYGVTRSARRLTAAIEVLEPVSVLVTGAGFLLLGLYRRGGLKVAPRLILKHLVPIGLFCLITSVAGLGFLFGQKTTEEVSCCSMVFDQPNRFSAQSIALISSQFGARLLLSLTQSIAMGYLCVQLVLLSSLWPSRRRLFQYLVVLLAPVHLIAAILTLFESLAPTLTGIAGHHCAYCLANSDTYPSVLAYVLVVFLGLATFIPLWTFWIRRLVPEWGPGEGRGWQVWSVLCLVAYWAAVLLPYYRAVSTGAGAHH
jgi:hypothetical protein